MNLLIESTDIGIEYQLEQKKIIEDQFYDEILFSML
jgi:hypothetical protein